jgi:hypothetical protein
MLTPAHPHRRTRSAHRAAICAARIRPGGPAAGFKSPAPTANLKHPVPMAGYGHPSPTAGSKQFAPIQAARAGARQTAPELIA